MMCVYMYMYLLYMYIYMLLWNKEYFYKTRLIIILKSLKQIKEKKGTEVIWGEHF